MLPNIHSDQIRPHIFVIDIILKVTSKTKTSKDEMKTVDLSLSSVQVCLFCCLPMLGLGGGWAESVMIIKAITISISTLVQCLNVHA